MFTPAQRRRNGRRLATTSQNGIDRVRHAGLVAVEHLEQRQLLAAGGRLIGITGNQGHPELGYIDETLWEITYGEPGSKDPVLLDGFADIVGNPPDTVLSISGSVGVTNGKGALRVDVPNGVGAFWGFQSPNIVDALKAGANLLMYDMTLTNVELNGGSYGGGTDNSFNGFAQSNELAIVINTPTGGFIQRNFTTGGAIDTSGKNGTWSGFDGTRQISWDLTQFTSNGMSLQDFINANPTATDARIWFVTQGGDNNGNTGPMRFYFDNITLFGPGATQSTIGDFELLAVNKILTLPFVPDTDAIGFNPDSGLLHRTSGASAYSNNPSSNGFNDNQFMETIDLNSSALTQTAIFNANYQGQGSNGPYGLPAPRPDWIRPVERRTDAQTDASFRQDGPNEYHSARDLVWNPTEHVFYVADELGLFKLTADGHSTFIGRPAPGPSDPPAGEDDLKGLAFFTVNGQRRLLASERADSDSPANLWTLDPATGQKIGQPVVMTGEDGQPLAGVVSLIESPDGSTLLGIGQHESGFNGAINRELIVIDPVTGVTRSLGKFGMHMSDLAFVIPPPFRVTTSEFVYQTAPHRLKVTFDRDIDPTSLQPTDLSIRKAPAGTPFNATAVTYDAASRTATLTLADQPLADGDYTATLAAGSVNEPQGAALQEYTTSFFVFAGDANHDRTVDFNDLVALAQNYNTSGKTFPEGDFNYDGNVDFNDLVTLAQKYNTTLPFLPAAPVAATASAISTPVTRTTAPKPRRADDRVFNTVVPIAKPKPLATPKPAPKSRR
jgi:hypothetical protein